MRRTLTLVAVAALAAAAQPARAVVQITEWMYNPASGDGEFVEITNRGAAPVNMTGWSFDDSSRTAGSFSLTGLGTLAAGESALITELTAAAFRTDWSLAASVKVAGGSTQNLSRNDEINIFDAGSTLVDRLTYNDEGTGNVNGPRTQGVSANPPLGALGANNASLWTLSTAVDIYGSVTSANNNVGNPGKYLIPEPASAALAVLGLCALGLCRRRIAH